MTTTETTTAPQILNITQTHTVDSYPYGRLRCTAFFSIEFKEGKGFRSVFQTINPKNNRVNAPKKSTYSEFIYNVVNPHNGHIETAYLSFYRYENLEATCKKLAAIIEPAGLTPDMIKHLARTAITTLFENYLYNKKEAKEALWPMVKPTIDKLEDIAKTGINLFSEVIFDYKAYKEAQKNLPEISFVTTQAVSLSTLN